MFLRSLCRFRFASEKEIKIMNDHRNFWKNDNTWDAGKTRPNFMDQI